MDLWAWTTTDDQGDQGVAYIETTGGTRIPCLATSESGARAFRPIVETMAGVTNRPWVLRQFREEREVETVRPR